MHAFSADAARSLAGDDPRQGADRAAAAERAAGMVWPSATEEIWRYSRIGDLNIDDFTPAAATTTVDAPGQESAFVTSAPGAGGPVAALVDGPPPDVFAELNAAFAAPVQITVPAGAYAAATDRGHASRRHRRLGGVPAPRWSTPATTAR